MAVNNRVKITNDIELKDRLVAINRVTKVTKGGRTFSFSAIVVVGNEDGIIGWGLGKAGEVTAVSPYEMVYTNEHYYLICVPDHDPHTRLYRIDRMADIRILDEPRSEKPAQKQEAQDAVYAFVGAPERVVLHCDRAVLDDVLDRFGTDIQIFERDEQTFTAVLTTPPRGVRFWALQYLSFVEVAEPAWLRQEIIDALKGNHYLT